ncbi:hypothetical protein DPEC_G00266630 [Dallia pectoralis]|uniref:Uncharacterized protein n=1 Tax=Dallia pectoralis TaxID=75939 RepID=A0ACC2FNG5_DALPE|nr:hypothetical protein DPEC_G00266630 [Dallia pectoralis]
MTVRKISTAIRGIYSADDDEPIVAPHPEYTRRARVQVKTRHLRLQCCRSLQSKSSAVPWWVLLTGWNLKF